MAYNLQKYTLIILASTFPRWRDDSVPGFVLDFARAVRPSVRRITAIVPHYKGAKQKDMFEPDIRVRRFRYAIPYKYENIAYGQFKKTKLYPIKALLYAASEFWSTLFVGMRNRPVILNAHWIIPQGFVAVLVAPLLRAKVVVSVHGADVFTLNGKYMRKVKRFVLKHADLVVANSSATQAECVKLWPHKDYPVIPMGIDTERFAAARSQRSSKTFEVIFVGRFVAVKGIPYLCKAIDILHKKHENVHLNLIGDGPDRPEIEAYVKEHNLGDVITLAGWVQHHELADSYGKADVFVGPSIKDDKGWQEALGLVFAEASAAGLPVVGTNVGGITDIVQDKQTGLVVSPKDPEAIVDALEYLYNHPEEGKNMGEYGRKFVQENFSWQSVAERYVQAIESIF